MGFGLFGFSCLPLLEKCRNNCHGLDLEGFW